MKFGVGPAGAGRPGDPELAAGFAVLGRGTGFDRCGRPSIADGSVALDDLRVRLSRFADEVMDRWR